MTTYKLGPLPWSDETLARAYFQSFVAAYEAIREHPGYTLHKRVESLSAALRLFNKWCARFIEDIGRFHVEFREGGIMHRTRNGDLQQLEESFQESLYVIASTAMTLVDQSRGIEKHVVLAGYEEKKDAFVKCPAHRFIQELRNDVVHVSLHQPNWQISVRADGISETEMVLYPHQLQRADGWHSLAKQYLQERPEGVHIGALISEYQEKVTSLHKWLHQAITEAKGDVISEYLLCDRRLKAIGSHATWRMLLTQVVIQNKKDPFDYLDRYLTPEELLEVNNLPARSQQQVDRIIELIDEYGACNQELRELTYQAFAVGDVHQCRDRLS